MTKERMTKDKKPKALLLAFVLEYQSDQNELVNYLLDAAAELRRLHEVEKEYLLFLSTAKTQLKLLPERKRT